MRAWVKNLGVRIASRFRAQAVAHPGNIEALPPQTGWSPITVCLPGRATELEVIVHTLNATNASGVGRVLSFGERRSISERL
jgi:hypothetical protein